MSDFEGSVFVGIVFLKLPICWDSDSQSSLEFLEKGSNKKSEQQQQLDGSGEHGHRGFRGGPNPHLARVATHHNTGVEQKRL